MPLGIDATIRYSTNNWKRPIRQSELDKPEPYNTRLNRGAAADADRQPRARVDQGRRQALQARTTSSTSASPASRASTRSRRPTRSSRRTSRSATRPRATANDPARRVRLAGRSLTLAADAQRGVDACSAWMTGTTSSCRCRRICSRRPSWPCRPLGFRGVNVTIPHKEAALALADDATETARAIGAANTLTFEADGAIHADNTDALGLPRTRSIAPPTTARRWCSARAEPRAPCSTRCARRAPGSSASGTARPTAPRRSPTNSAPTLGAAPADIVVNTTSVGLSDPEDTFKALPLASR